MPRSHDVPAVVIPFRDRHHHLPCLLSRLRGFCVIVVEQTDDLPFNRGALLNAGYVKARELGHQRVILHDCDLIPDDTLLRMYDEPWPRPVVHFGARFRRYNNSRTYFGGVHGFTAGHFPGYPNHFWGWGGEDDALRKRTALRNCTYARCGEYLDLEGYGRPGDKLRTLLPEHRCQNKRELLASDNQQADNHRSHTLVQSMRWEHSDGMLWGFIRHRRGA